MKLTPWGSPALERGAGIDEVETNEAHELGDQCILNRHNCRAPASYGGEDTDCIARVAMHTSVLGPLQAPVDGTQERDDLRIVSKSEH